VYFLTCCGKGVYKSPPLLPILCQINPVHVIPSYFSKTGFNTVLSSHRCLGLPNGLFPSKTLYAFLFLHVHHQSHPPSFCLPYYICQRLELMKRSPASCWFIPLQFKYSSQNPVLHFWFRRVRWDRVHLLRRPLIVLLYQATIIDECGAFSGMRIGRGNRNTWRKPAPVPRCPPQIPHDLI
jgi:hypothetical protein